jgi:3',5'-cyclic-nucleotide phosphodiesterase
MNIFTKLLFSGLKQPDSESPVFNVVALGVYGGLKESNLSSYIVKPVSGDDYVSLDSGTLVTGLNKSFENTPDKGADVLSNHIPAYLISHAHFDHFLGFVMAQPELHNQQAIMARQETMQELLSHVFIWAVWGNFGDAGEEPHLNHQHYQSIPLLEWVPIPKTDMQVKAFPLSHGHETPSTAFLLRFEQAYLLYFGDTGADEIEETQTMQAIWKEVAPLVRKNQLRGIFLECSFPEEQPSNRLFGHLKPSLYMKELSTLANLVDPKHPEKALKDLTVFVTHVKPTIEEQEDSGQKILSTLQSMNHLGIRFVLPEQGGHYVL